MREHSRVSHSAFDIQRIVPRCVRPAMTPVGSPSTSTACGESSAATAGSDEQTRRLFDDARIPPRYRRCDFDNFQVYPQNEKLANAVDAVRRFAESFPDVAKGLCLIGPHGIGKTHLAVAALRAALARGNQGLFYEVSRPAARDSQHLQPGDQDGGDGHPAAARLAPSCSSSTTSARRRRRSGSRRR